MKLIELDLPAFAFLDGNCHEGNTLKNRTVIMHIRSASVLEFFHDDVLLNEGVISKKTHYINKFGITEQLTCALHFSPILQGENIIIEEIINPAILWYKKYLKYEDNNIVNDKKSKLN